MLSDAAAFRHFHRLNRWFSWAFINFCTVFGQSLRKFGLLILRVRIGSFQNCCRLNISCCSIAILGSLITFNSGCRHGPNWHIITGFSV
ncbi:MAG: hypothetical protein GY826_43260 [Fuerstiella sp.]|nr:hypothetical protein [Fuerstiella sp.]